MSLINAVLFDLDGTLLDTAPDLVYAINRLRNEHGLSDLSLETIRPIVSHGAKAMLKLALGIDENDKNFQSIREYFLEIYQNHLADDTQLFPNIDKVLTHLEAQRIPWGIVTNKPTKPTLVLLKALDLHLRPGCVICGDSLPTNKPDPGTILHGCEKLKQAPANCLYIGDAATDVIASKAAGTLSLVALYGYINANEDPYAWQADGYIKEPLEIIHWLQEFPSIESV